MAMDPSQMGGPGGPPPGQAGPDPMTLALLAKMGKRKKGKAHGRPHGHKRKKGK